MKTLIITISDIGSYARISITDGVATEIDSGGIPTDYVLRNANLFGSPEEIRAVCESTFNANGSDYIATIEATRRATIYEAGNGLPGFRDTVLADETLWQIVSADADLRIRTNGPGTGNSIEATLLAIADQCDLTAEQWDVAHDGRVILH